MLERIGAILEEAGTDWSKVLKTTVLVQSEFSSFFPTLLSIAGFSLTYIGGSTPSN